MPRARSASTMRASIVAGNGAYTGGRAGKCREAVMQGPVEAEINRSSKISPSIGATVSWRREAARFLAASARLDGGHHVVLHGRLQRGEHRQRAEAPAPVASARPHGAQDRCHPWAPPQI